MSALQQITKRAKQLRNANKNLAWSAAIKKASAEYRAKNKGKKPVARKVKKAAKKKRKVGSTLLLERGENPRKKPTRIVKIQRTKAGTFKKFSKISGSPAVNAISGIGGKEIALRDIMRYTKELEHYRKAQAHYVTQSKNKSLTAVQRRAFAKDAKAQVQYIKYFRAQLTRAKNLL